MGKHSDTQPDDPLGSPGDGIPWLERTALGMGIRGAAVLIAKDRLTALFRAEAERAMTLASALSAADGRRRVLIPRFFGIEDNSRGWSVFMALEHLVIVNSAIAAMLPRLYSARGPAVEVQPEQTKPVPEAGPEQIRDLARVVDRYGDIVDKLGNLRAGERFAHPWYGPLSAAQWHALAAIHNSTHRRQIERIIRALQADAD
ncbi:DinB family protein [Thiohalocapsa marina]|uniref:DinB family protein n=1 Tax=Thiohalocapsa marina TaxID=424902 RepID=A0A5M8FIM9_9GAMM|nr:DinB family protein [Thiohalocapsa marina]KAA6182991.1 DinB family protein [Thiohalocapsa marina]